MSIGWGRIRLLIIDFDNTLVDTFHTLSRGQWEYVEKKLKEKGWHEEYRKVKDEFGKHGFKHTLENSGMTPEQIRYALKHYDDIDVSGLVLFPDAEQLLELPMDKVLITRGEPSLQQQKIDEVGVRGRFKEIVIVPTFEDKRGAIMGILRDHDVLPEEALIIGDRVEEEIADGHALGIPTVLVRRPDLPEAEGGVQPDLTVHTLAAIVKRIKKRR